MNKLCDGKIGAELNRKMERELWSVFWWRIFGTIWQNGVDGVLDIVSDGYAES